MTLHFKNTVFVYILHYYTTIVLQIYYAINDYDDDIKSTVKSHCRINARLFSFVPRNINMQSLSECLVKCGTVQTFRRHLDRIDFSKFITCQ